MFGMYTREFVSLFFRCRVRVWSKDALGLHVEELEDVEGEGP